MKCFVDEVGTSGPPDGDVRVVDKGVRETVASGEWRANSGRRKAREMKGQNRRNVGRRRGSGKDGEG